MSPELPSIGSSAAPFEIPGTAWDNTKQLCISMVHLQRSVQWKAFAIQQDLAYRARLELTVK